MFQEYNILHEILKKKFKNTGKKKKMLKELVSKHVLFGQYDKDGKLPIDYE
jgi:hypothetical protein